MFDEDLDEDVTWEGWDHDEDDELCSVPTCDQLTDSDTCECCGIPLCPMHHELGCGFCPQCPTPTWVAEQRDESRTSGEETAG